MKHYIIIFIFCFGCLKAQKSAFDFSNPGGSGLFSALGLTTLDLNLNNVSVDTYTLTSISYSPSTKIFAVGVAISDMTPIVQGTAESYSLSQLTDLPPGLSFNTTTGIISGTPTTENVTPTTFTITATNAVSTVSTNITLSVNMAPPGTLSYSGTGTGVTCQCGATIRRYTFTRTLTASLSGTATGATNFSINPTLPTGLSIDATNGTIYGVPTATQDFLLYTITATNVSGTVTAQVYIKVQAVIYAATWGGGLGISTNNGNSFTMNTLAGTNINDIDVAPDGTIYVASNSGLYKSTNNASSFSTIWSNQTAKVFVVPGGSNTVYAARNGEAISLIAQPAIYRSIDSGANFTQLSFVVNNYIRHIAAYSSATIYFGTYLADSNVYKSTDGINLTQLAFPPNDIDGLYVTANKLYVVRAGVLKISTNGGSSFSTIDVDILSNNEAHLVASPDDTKVFVGSTSSGVFVSTDSGASFTQKTTTSGLSGNIINDLFLDNYGILYVGTSNGLSVANDTTGTNFTDKSTGLSNLNIQSVYVR